MPALTVKQCKAFASHVGEVRMARQLYIKASVCAPQEARRLVLGRV